jgi:hypothetical protein
MPAGESRGISQVSAVQKLGACHHSWICLGGWGTLEDWRRSHNWVTALCCVLAQGLPGPKHDMTVITARNPC